MTPFWARWTNNTGDTYNCRVFGFYVSKELSDGGVWRDETYAIVQLVPNGALTNVDFTDIFPLPAGWEGTHGHQPESD